MYLSYYSYFFYAENTLGTDFLIAEKQIPFNFLGEIGHHLEICKMSDCFLNSGYFFIILLYLIISKEI